MAKCPGCQTNIGWDWCQDDFKNKDTGMFLKKEEKTIELNGADSEVSFTFCDCGNLISISVSGGNQDWDLFNSETFAGSGVDWEDDEHNATE